MARAGPAAGVHESFAVDGPEVFACGDALVLFALKVPLLLVRDEFKGNEGDHGEGSKKEGTIHNGWFLVTGCWLRVACCQLVVPPPPVAVVEVQTHF